MKANELMIGSLVEHNGYVYKVTGIYGNTKFVDLFPCRLRNKENLLLGPLTVMEKEISPIPLTEEILKLNGFRAEEYSGGILFYWEKKKDSKAEGYVGIETRRLRNSDKFFVGTVTKNTPEFMLHLNSIHELQHALRLCGLNELADNFKV